MSANTRRTDGESIQLIAPVAVEGGEPVLINGWHGIADTDADAGKLVSVEVAQAVHELELASGSPAIGSVVYIHGTTAGANVTLDVTASGGVAFAKVVEVDATNPLIVLAKLLENAPDAT